jgi:AcrR family transcriptional regulator
MQQPASTGLSDGVKKPDRKGRLLQVACEHFLLHGYNGTSLDAIIAETGGSKSTLYRHFTNKEGLFSDVVAHLCAEFLAKLQSIEVKGTSLELGLRAILMELVNVITSPRHVSFYRLVIAGSAQFPEAGRAWYENGPLVSQGVILRLLDELEEQGKIGASFNKPVIASILFDSLLSNLTTQVVILGKVADKAVVNAMVEELITIIREHIAALASQP